MKILPLLARVTIRSPRGWAPTLWLPLFLVWPIVLLVLAPLFALALVLVLVVQARALPSLFALLGGIYTLLCELRGTLVDVHGPDSRVLISIS